MPQNWEEIYKEAVYVVKWKDEEICFKIGKHSKKTDEILTQNNAGTFAFLTAYNPLSQKVSNEENERRQAELIKLLQAENYQFLKGYGTNEDESWEREKSLFILKITEDEAVKIARKFEQNAIVFGERNESAKLVWCDSQN